jgi:hypothetical protein
MAPSALTSPAFDLRGFVGCELRFWRWLGVGDGTWDHGAIEVSPDGGATWVVVWDHAGPPIVDDQWLELRYDISPWADDRPEVRIRFVMGPTGGPEVMFGWNIDDLALVAAEQAILQGTVSAASSGAPVAGALVRLEGTRYSDQTDDTGAYRIQAPAGVFEVTVWKKGYNMAEIPDVELTASETTVLDVALTAPEIDVDPGLVTVELEPGEVAEETLRIANLGDGPLHWRARFAPAYERGSGRSGSRSLETWDLLMDIDAGELTGDIDLRGAEFGRGSLWVSGAGSQIHAPPHYLYEIAADGSVLLHSYEQAAECGEEWGYPDLAFDGEYLYAGCGDRFYQLDPADGSVMFEVEHTLGAEIRGLAYVPERDTFIAGDDWFTCYEFAFDGVSLTLLRTFRLERSGRYGLAYDDQSEGGPYLWIFDSGGMPGTTLYQADIRTPGAEHLTGVSYHLPLLSGLADQWPGGLFVSGDWVPGLAVLGGLVRGYYYPGFSRDKVFGLELTTLASWLQLGLSEGELPPGPEGSEVEIALTFDAGAVDRPGLYTGVVQIASNDGDEDPVLVPVEMLVAGGGILEGRVAERNGDPVVGAEVLIEELGRSRVSDDAGRYRFQPLPPGEDYTVRCVAEGYNPAVVSGVRIVAGETTTLTFIMTRPEMRVEPRSYERTQPPGRVVTIPGALTMQNVGDGPLSWRAEIVVRRGAAARTGNRKVLVAVDVAGHPGFWDPTPAYVAALEALGFVEIETIAAPEQGPIPWPDPFTAEEYAFAVVLTGENWWPAAQGFDPEDEAVLAAYQESGGNVLIVGQDLLWGAHPTWGQAEGYFRTWIGLDAVQQDVLSRRRACWILGAPGTFAEGLDFVILGSSGGGPFLSADLNIDSLTPVGAGIPLLLADRAMPAAIAFDSGASRSVFSTLELAAAENEADFHGAMAAIFRFLSEGSIPPWVSILPQSGALPPGANQRLDLTFDTIDYPEGDYTVEIRFSWDVSEEVLVVPVTLHVSLSPTVTPTTEPTASPTAPPPCPTPTPTPVPTTPLPATATPVGCGDFRVEMEAAASFVHPGDLFWVTAHICNPDPPEPEAPFVAMLDIGTDEYWFYPSWSKYPPDFDYLLRELPHGWSQEPVVPEFRWPDTGSSSLAGIRIYGAVLNQEMTAIRGGIGYVEFAFGPGAGEP